jgi:hypothetical protein
MTSLTTAQQTYEWLTQTGRISGEAEAIVKSIGLDEFLTKAAKIWESQGSPMFMNGMKAVMLKIIWG